MKTYIFLLSTVLGIVLTSCSGSKEESEEPKSELIEISKNQFQSEKMKLGEPAYSTFSDIVYFTGSIVTSSNGKANISLTFPGKIVKIFCKKGQSVKRGDLLFEVSGNDFIDIQKDFSESSAILSKLKSDFDRGKELFDEGIGSKKEFIIVESAFYAEQARYNGLKLKIQNIGLSIEKIAEGKFYSSYVLRSPIDGNITDIMVNIGQFVEPNQNLAEIVDQASFLLELSIFEKDINKLKIGQTVNYYLSGNKMDKQKAVLKAIGKTIDPQIKSIACYAEIEDMGLNLVENQFMEGEVVVSEDTVLSVPKTAISKYENYNYVFVLENETSDSYFFKKVLIKTGRENSENIELLEKPESKPMLIEGIYNIN